MGNPSASGWHRTPPQETCAAQELLPVDEVRAVGFVQLLQHKFVHKGHFLAGGGKETAAQPFQNLVHAVDDAALAACDAQILPCGPQDIQYSWFVHSFENIVSPEEYGEAHPEYFAMDKEGVRMLTPYKNQLCLSNPELVPIAVAAVRKNLTADIELRAGPVPVPDVLYECHVPLSGALLEGVPCRLQ